MCRRCRRQEAAGAVAGQEHQAASRVPAVVPLFGGDCDPRRCGGAAPHHKLCGGPTQFQRCGAPQGQVGGADPSKPLNSRRDETQHTPLGRVTVAAVAALLSPCAVIHACRCACNEHMASHMPNRESTIVAKVGGGMRTTQANYQHPAVSCQCGI